MRVSSAPGKLILSGEHAVVYGNPALAVAVEQHVTVDILPNTSPTIRVTSALFNEDLVLTSEDIAKEHEKIIARYQEFLNGQRSIQTVLSSPEQLIIATLYLALTHCRVVNPAIHITLDSTMSPGAGLGSSAATILSLLLGVCDYLTHTLTQEEAFELALHAENLQHGKSSGLDIYLSLAGGCQWIEHQQLHPRKMTSLPLYIAYSGQPICSTGECVSHVKPLLENHPDLLQQFSHVTHHINDACEQDDYEQLKQGLRENHRLLCQIGVVPTRVQAMISKIEQLGDAAKICGAGAIRGDPAGYILVLCQDNPTIKYDFLSNISKLNINFKGASPVKPHSSIDKSTLTLSRQRERGHER